MAPPNIVLVAPAANFGGTWVAVDGTTFAISSAGLMTIPSTYIKEALTAGFLMPSDGTAANAITAFATGGQTNATQLVAMYDRISVCATAGDSVKLWPATPGMVQIVENDGATAADIFPQTGESLGVQAANVAFRIPAGGVVFFQSFVAGVWQPHITVVAMAKYTLNTTSGATTAAAGDLTGAAYVSAAYSAVGAANLTTRTAAQMIVDGGLRVGQSYALKITNTSGGTTTLVGGTGVTLTGTMTMATNTTRDFIVTVTAAGAITIQSIGVGTIS